MADIIYNIENLENAKKSIDKLIEQLQNDNSRLNESLIKLQNDWKTDAGKKFFETHTDTWSEYVGKYIHKLTGVSDMLQKAIEHYEKIGNEVKNLKV